ncbi:MAG: hypothetical protein IJ456_00925 [Bacteroides sp.]|nr:hypothetical protein [Bacteroides sp.]
MKKLFFICAVLFTAFGVQVHAQKSLGYFNSVAIGVNGGTTGYGFDLAAPIGNHFAIRAGITIMPDLSLSDEVDISSLSSVSSSHYDIPTSMEVEGSLKRTAFEALLNIYPFKHSSFFITGGAAWGGEKLVTVTGHSEELAKLQSVAEGAGIEIGDYIIPVDKQGNVSGGIKVSNFRPFVGMGFGRIVPKNRIGFLFEMGVQFHKTPEVYTDYGNLEMLTDEADNDFSEIIEKVTVYPVIRFRICGRLF